LDGGPLLEIICKIFKIQGFQDGCGVVAGDLALQDFVFFNQLVQVAGFAPNATVEPLVSHAIARNAVFLQY
jgi:hypothetical protein